MIGHFGVLARLHDEKLLDEVVHWYGCSGGAMCALFGILGCSAEWLRDSVRYFESAAALPISDDLLVNFMSSWGVIPGEAYRDMIGRFADTWEPGSSGWTFADLSRERPGRSLHIVALNVSQQRYEVFNAATTPTMRVMDAVMASSSIPLIFTPWRSPVTGDIYCDGGVIEQFPWRHVVERENTLVIACSDAEIRDYREPLAIHTVGDYVGHIFHAIRRNMISMIPEKPRHWIAVNNRTVVFVDFKMTEEDRLRFFDEGVSAAAAWVAFMRDASARKHGTNPPGDPSHHTLSFSHQSQVQMLDNHQPRILEPSSNLKERQYTKPQLPSRRWSL